MEKSNYQYGRTAEELDVKGILLQLAFGAVAGLMFIGICGLAELVADLFQK